jgi:integrase
MDREDRRYESAIRRLETLRPENREKIKDFLEEMESNSIGYNRLIQMAGELKVIASFLDDKFLKPDKKDIIRFMNSKKGNRDKTKNHYVIMLKQFYKWLEGVKVPPAYVDFLKLISINLDSGKEDNITKDETVKIINNMANERDKVITQLLFDSGCRIGEIMASKRKDIKFTDKGTVLRVAGREEGAKKTGSRDVYLFGDSIPMLRDYLRSRPQNQEAYIFTMLQGDTTKPCNYESYVRNLKKAVRESGIQKRVHAHLFRHGRATELVARGINQAVLEKQMGWSLASKTARVYINLNPEEIRKRMNEVMGIVEPEDHKEPVVMKICQRCGHENPSYAVSCSNCWFPLEIEKALELDRKENETISILEGNKDMLDGTEKKLLDIIKTNPELMDKLLLELLRSLKDKGKL